MKTSKTTIIALVLCVAFAAVGMATETGKEGSVGAESSPHAAVFKVPNLDVALAKQLVKTLAELDGITAAKPDTNAGTMAVTFSPAKVKAKQISEAMAKVAPEVSLESIGPVDAKQAKGKCGGCPHKKACAKKKETETETEKE